MTEFELIVEAEPGSVSEEGITRSPVFRSQYSDGELVKDCKGCQTIYTLYKYSTEQFSEQPLHGKRQKFRDGSVGEYIWQTYADVEETVRHVAKGMRLQGCQRDAKIGIYSANCPEWTQTLLAAAYFGAVSVPLYDTLGGSAVEHAILQSEIEFICVAEKNCRALSEVIASMGTKANQIREICIWEDYSQTEAAQLEASKKVFQEAGILVERWEDLIQRGKASHAAPLEEPCPAEDPETIAVIMYTGGTTGVPKGVALSHRALVSAVGSTLLVGEKTKVMLGASVHLSWLTNAHVYGFVMELLSIAAGSKVGYWQGDVKKLMDDIAALKPTQVLAVPRVWVQIMERATDRIEKSGTIQKGVFEMSYAFKKSLLEYGIGENILTSAIDALVFSRLRNALGGNVQFVGSGAAPLPRHVEEFFRIALTVPLIQGYGLTETCATTCMCSPNRYDQMGTVGSVTPCAEMRLESVPEMGYDAQGSPPSGEICFRGPCLFSSYHKNPEEYKKAVDKEGFFHTGDIGEIRPCGSLKIVDRKKNIFKLSQGEYVAVEKIESSLQQASAVKQIWVYGDSCQRFLVAIIHPHAQKLEHLMVGEPSLEEICKSDLIKREVLKELTEVGKAAGLKGFERVHDIGLVPEEFTVENGLMTPSQKLKRHDLLQRYKHMIDSLYGETSSS